ncbi:Type I restriction enzyme EcoKI R protein [Marine Group I thaumarchaeote SCGC AAA799-P11]|uniref:Type I restriction enzyme EcoKI R protein n=1 Tax=Marine Group I thaumarchaeote SCGC AAA799-P11 TaxID=1502295 RepID=A0A087RXZ7_9ARCH|nr:Type I restriction enzyme EcoKI R protein [Marine Group I thaumarchaeote SCGC AAA799-P11]
MNPEDKARKDIDKMLTDSGWIIQDYEDRNLSAGLGVAVREYPLSKDNADYALFIDSQPVGVVEAKKAGHTLSGVVEQSEKYLDGLHEKFTSAPMRPPFSYETTGIETIFADRRDPNHRSRYVFSFHRPELLQEWLHDDATLRARLTQIPKLDYANLRDCQTEAITNLEDSFSQNKPRALIQMATGSGKTFTAVTTIYRLIKFAKAKRVLFLVDRNNLGLQALKEFQQYKTPDDGRAFTDLYNVQHLQSHTVDPVSKVVISTVQRMFSILKGEKEYVEENDEFSSFEETPDETPVEVTYNENIPIGEFDFIVIDECHRSIYNKWRQVLDYFDSFLIGLTATPSNDTIGFFNNNQVMRYNHERAVVDEVNVGYHVYKIKTKITEDGSTVEAGQYVEKRDRLTRKQESELLDDDLIYAKNEVDKSVVSKDRIRLIIRTFKERLTEIFPNRTNVPKTLIFAKDDSHAEDITEIVREEFGSGNEFCKKITYRTKEKPEDLISSFRNSPMPRIAVTVDMIATGTDIKPLECIIFMRDVRTKNYFDQMKGRGTRTITPDDLMSVTPDAKAKTHFVIVDAVGVCEHAMSDTHSLSTKPNVSFKKLLDKATDKNADTGDVESLVYRLSRLNRKLSDEDKKEIADANNGKSLTHIEQTLLDGIDQEKRVEKAKEQFKTAEPTKDQIHTVSKQMIDEACKVFDSAKLRRTILDIKSKNEQIIDDVSIDELLEAGFSDKVQNIDKTTVENWQEFLEKNKDQITALDIIYSKPYRMKEVTFADIKELANAIQKPPYNLTPEALWSAYQRLDKSKVRNNPVKMLTDLIPIIRYSAGEEQSLLPFSEIIDSKFEKWLVSQESSGKQFTPEQKEWLVMIKNSIASSVSISMDDLDDVPFNQKGGRVKFYEIFGDDYEKILEELHEVLINQ